MELDPFWVFHFGNGYDSGAEEVTFDLSLHDTPNFMTHDGYAVMDGTWDGHVSAALTYGQVRLNVRTGHSQIDTFPSFGATEFLRVNPHAGLSHHSHTLMLAERSGAAPGEAPWFGRLVLYNRLTDQAQTYDAPDTEMMEEHVIVPDPGNAEAFWIVGSSQDWAEGATYLSVYAGHDLAAGPLYRARMAGTLPLGLHGTFVSSM